MEVSLDPVTGQLLLAHDLDCARCEAAKASSVLDLLPSDDREVIRHLYGIGCEQLDPETLAERFDLTPAETWLVAERAFAFVGETVVLGLAA